MINIYRAQTSGGVGLVGVYPLHPRRIFVSPQVHFGAFSVFSASFRLFGLRAVAAGGLGFRGFLLLAAIAQAVLFVGGLLNSFHLSTAIFINSSVSKASFRDVTSSLI